MLRIFFAVIRRMFENTHFIKLSFPLGVKRNPDQNPSIGRCLFGCVYGYSYDCMVIRTTVRSPRMAQFIFIADPANCVEFCE